MKKIKVTAQRTCFYEFTMQVPVNAGDDEISLLVSEEMYTESYEAESDIDWEDEDAEAANIVDIVIPTNENDTSGLIKGSAVLVSREVNYAGFCDLYYEGNKYGASNLHAFDEKLLVAGGRMRDKAPTVARSYMKPSNIAKAFIKVGEYDLNKFEATITDQASLDEWCCCATESGFCL